MQSPDLKKLHRECAAATLKHFRRKHLLKRSYIAQLLQVSTSTIDKIEQGKICLRLTDTIELCAALGIGEMDFINHLKEVIKKAKAATQTPTAVDSTMPPMPAE